MIYEIVNVGKGLISSIVPENLLLINDETSTIVERTREQISSLILTKSLVRGTIYKITGVHKSLYNDGTESGTTIFLEALSDDTLSAIGYGEFWDPLYGSTSIWDDKSTLVSSISAQPVGNFTNNENITSNNGATATMIGIPFILGDRNHIVILSNLIGDWSSVSSITGNTSGATLLIAQISRKTSYTDEKIIWGGYSWTNISGNLGSNVDVLNLSVDWLKDTYSLDDYNKSIHIIEYDNENDFIYRRFDPLLNNNVINTYDNFQDYNQDEGLASSIASFMFGNSNLFNNNVSNSYLECINFMGNRISNNVLSNNSAIFNNIIMGGSSIIDYNNLTNSYIGHNLLLDSNITNNQLYDGGEISHNSFSAGGIYNNILHTSQILLNVSDSGNIVNNILESNSVISGNSVSTQSVIEKNKLVNSYIADNNIINFSNILKNNLNNATILNNVMSDALIEGNTCNTLSFIENNTVVNTSKIYMNILNHNSKILNNSLTTSLIQFNMLNDGVLSIGTGIDILSKTISLITFEGGIVIGDITAATILFSNYHKTVYGKPDGTTKIRYYNNNDLLIIADILD